MGGVAAHPGSLAVGACPLANATERQSGDRRRRLHMAGSFETTGIPDSRTDYSGDESASTRTSAGEAVGVVQLQRAWLLPVVYGRASRELTHAFERALDRLPEAFILGEPSPEGPVTDPSCLAAALGGLNAIFCHPITSDQFPRSEGLILAKDRV
jgi:hypothetical protein